MLVVNKQNEWDSFVDKIDTKDSSIYKLNECLLNKWPSTYFTIINPTGMVGISSQWKSRIDHQISCKSIYAKSQINE